MIKKKGVNVKRKIKAIICLPLFLYFSLFILFMSCGNQKKESLNINDYLKHADGDKLYPSVTQIDMLRGLVPKTSFSPAPTIINREYWNKIISSESGKAYFEKALLELDYKPEVPISDSIYRLANKQGNRGIYKPRYYRTMDRLERFILAECLENKGRFLEQIVVYSQAILSMKSWLHPNHDDDNNGVLKGERVTIDLGARKFGSVLTLVETLLGDKLEPGLRKDIKKQLQKRIIDSYLKSCEFLDINNKWIKSTSNWNSVCTSGAVFVTIATSKNEEERLAAIGSAINGMKYYLSGFGEDGYCSEGLGYWRYGFGHYLYLSQILYDYTDGKINMFEGGNPKKLNNVGNFPEKFEIQNGRCAPFADGVSTISKKGSNFSHVLAAKHYDAEKPTEIRMEEAVEQLIAWQNPSIFNMGGPVAEEKSKLPNYSYFDDFGMVISRGKQKIPFSIGIKAGHNAENHNHSDVGTYTIILDKDIIAGDIGAPSYTAGAFSKDNKARSSWGHPVPRVNGVLQSNGRQFEGDITETIFGDNMDKVVMNIKPAYELPMLNSLIRTMTNNKTSHGVITIEDSFMASEPVSFGTAVMTFSKYEIINANSFILTGKNQKIKVEIESKGGKVTINPEPVPVNSLREGKGRKATRIGIDFEKVINEGTIIVKYTPIN